jgi:chromosome partitioning protein
MPVIAAVNLKGGVGKTSCCMHIGGMIAQFGRRVLLIDNDPQGSLTAGFMGPTPGRQLAPSVTLAAVYDGADPYPEAVIRPTGFERLDLLPGSRHAAEANVSAPNKRPFEEQARLREFVDQVRDRYDLVLIDNPPNLFMATWGALAASDAWLCPLQAENFGAIGSVDVAESAAMVKAALNPSLERLGFLISMINPRRALHRAFAEELRAAHGGAVFDAMIPHAADFSDAVTACTPVGHFKPKGAAARAVRAVAEELMTRLAAPAVAGVGEAA